MTKTLKILMSIRQYSVTQHQNLLPNVMLLKLDSMFLDIRKFCLWLLFCLGDT